MKKCKNILLITAAFGFGVFIPQANKSLSADNDKVHSMMMKSNSTVPTKAEDYWIKTSIGKAELQKYVNISNCNKNSRTFLACVNSVLFALQKTNFRLNLDGQISSVLTSENRLDNFTEKENISPFLNIYSDGLSKTFSFEKIWSQILKIIPSNLTKATIASGINGYLSIAVDPHTYISPTLFFKNVSSNNERSKYFLGLSFEKKNSRIFIKKVFKNSDADLSGLKSNDEIVSINGRNVKNLNLSDVSDLLKDKNQKTFPFLIKRKSSAFVKKLNRSYRVLSQVQSEVINNGQKIGYIQLSKFAYNICENVRSEIQKMQPATLSGLVLDLRDNPGGLLTEAACLAGLFIGEDKKIFSIKYLNQETEEVALTTSEQIYFGPVAVLTNNSSASASELIAGALQEYKRATIIGERTFGKGTFQEIESWTALSDEISFFKTKGFYLLPSGHSTQAIGVTPDVILAYESASRNEFDNYLFPLIVNHENEKLSQVQYNGIESNSLVKRVEKSCSGLNYSNLSDDQFIATAQKVLSCEFNLSAQLELDLKNISL